MKGSNKILLSAVMMTLLSSTMAMPSTWAAAGINSDGRIFATTADSKFESTGSTTANGVVASDGGQVTIGSWLLLIHLNCLNAIVNQLSLQAC